MNILFLTVFTSLVLVVVAVVFFIYSVKNEDFDHGTQMSLKPLEEDKK